jgi:hypothetical protein
MKVQINCRLYLGQVGTSNNEEKTEIRLYSALPETEFRPFWPKLTADWAVQTATLSADDSFGAR